MSTKSFSRSRRSIISRREIRNLAFVLSLAPRIEFRLFVILLRRHHRSGGGGDQDQRLQLGHYLFGWEKTAPDDRFGIGSPLITLIRYG